MSIIDFIIRCSCGKEGGSEDFKGGLLATYDCECERKYLIGGIDPKYKLFEIIPTEAKLIRKR